jgi:diguanylate cyclase (GGDEF)-like protein
VVVVDLNDFAAVNATHGYMIGDALLVEVAAGLAERAAANEIVGRLDGDAFAVFVPDTASSAAALERARHFAEGFARPFSTGDRQGEEFVSLEASVGIALAPDHGGSVDAIISRATAAVAAAKAHAGSMLVYEAGMDG